MARLSRRTEEEKGRFREILTAISNLNRREMLAYWMDQEAKKAEMYHKLYQLSHDVNWDKLLPEFFFQLYKENLKHAEALLKVFKEAFPGEKPPKVDLPALDVKLSEERLREMVYHGDLQDILEYMMGTEKLAHDVYIFLLKASPFTAGMQ